MFMVRVLSKLGFIRWIMVVRQSDKRSIRYVPNAVFWQRGRKVQKKKLGKDVEDMSWLPSGKRLQFAIENCHLII